MKKLAIITSHPIQYNAPLFLKLTERGKISCRVFYTWGSSVLDEKFDPGFGKSIQWDIPLLQGYEHEFLENVAQDKGTHHFKGIINPSIISAIEAYKPDALLVYGWNFHSHLKVMRKYKGKIPVYFRGDSTILGRNEQSFLKRNVRKIFLKWVYNHIDVAFYVGNSNYDYFRNCGVKNKNLEFAPHAIDNERFFKESRNMHELSVKIRNDLKIQESDLVFLFAGKFEEIKNCSLIIESFLNGFANNSVVHLVLIGNGPLELTLRSVAAGHTNIHFMPFQNQSVMPAIYGMCDVFLLPSKSETWGLAINESMAVGKAVIVSDKCGCASDLLVHGENGFIVKANDPVGLTSSMKAFFSERTLAERMGLSSLSKISTYSYTNIAEAIEKRLLG